MDPHTGSVLFSTIGSAIGLVTQLPQDSFEFPTNSRSEQTSKGDQLNREDKPQPVEDVL